MVAVWIGNGVVMPSRARRSTRRSGRPEGGEAVVLGHLDGPLTDLWVALVQVSASARSMSGSM